MAHTDPMKRLIGKVVQIVVKNGAETFKKLRLSKLRLLKLRPLELRLLKLRPLELRLSKRRLLQAESFESCDF